MFIQSITLRTPSMCLTNEDLLQRIRNQNSDLPREAVIAYCNKVSRLFKLAGAETRYIRNKEGGESGFDLLLDAARSAIVDANICAGDIDLIIFCGVGRGFLEPANAAFVAKGLGISCNAFDVSEACMSWVRALQIAEAFFTARIYSKILVVNAEFTVYEHGIPDIFHLCRNEQIGQTFPALTIGEAATATVLTASDNTWNFRIRSAPEFAPLCNLPLPGYKDFCVPEAIIGANGLYRLVAAGMDMSRIAIREMVALVRQTYENFDSIDLVLPHNSSEGGIKTMATELNLGQKVYTGIFRQYGNLISASIPAAIVRALHERRLKRGDRILLCPASAGMVFGLVETVY